jgi:hypothetical protein
MPLQSMSEATGYVRGRPRVNNTCPRTSTSVDTLGHFSEHGRATKTKGHMALPARGSGDSYVWVPVGALPHLAEIHGRGNIVQPLS